VNVVLVGFRASGKSSVGRELAARLGREFVDCDEFVEKKAQFSIREIFERHGESHFRTLESQAVAELSKLDGRVLATGGGVVLKYQNIHALRRNGVVFFLDVAPETAYGRLQGDATTAARRPALTDKDPFSEVREQIEFRRPYYVKSADHTVATDGRPVADVVKEILKHLKDRGIDERQDQDEALA
jgi:shikimate kinase